MDMDAFFAAVESRDDPSLRGRPVVVGADPRDGAGRGVVSTANYPAREYGIGSGMPISEAYRRCPEAVFLPVDGDRYREVGDRIMACARRFGEGFERLSIDEAYLKLDGIDRFADAVDQAERLRARIRREFDLTCSVGAAANRELAKIASDVEKPDGLTTVRPGEERSFLAGRPVTVIPGVGEATAETLAAMGIETVDELAARGRQTLEAELGTHGAAIWETARGRGTTALSEDRERKSIGTETTFETDIASFDRLQDHLRGLCEEVADRLGDHGMGFGGVAVKVRTPDFTTYTRQRTLDSVFTSSEFLTRAATELLAEFEECDGYRLLGVRARELSSRSRIQAKLSRYLPRARG